MTKTLQAGVLSLVAVAGCATIMAGGPDVIPVATNPPNANVFVDGQFVGRTPMTISLDRHNPAAGKAIQIALDGYQPVSILRNKRINNWVWANLFWGLFPAVIDIVTGDWQTFGDDPIAIGMTPSGPMGPPPPDSAGTPGPALMGPPPGPPPPPPAN